MNTKVYNDVEFGDWVSCSECGCKMLVPCGSDRCPECGKVGCLCWVSENEDEKEVDINDIGCVKCTNRTLKSYEYNSWDMITIYIATSEWNNDEGVFVTSKPFRTITEAWDWAMRENNKFVSTYYEGDCDTEIDYGSHIYSVHYNDDYVNIDITKHEL